MKAILPVLIVAFTLTAPQARAEDVSSDLLGDYRAQGAEPFDAAAGQAMWTRKFASSGSERSCSACHGTDLRQMGKHVRTGKPIQPLAPSANPKRLTDAAKVEKWFTRNCKWTLGRACTPQEKGDFISFFLSQ